MGRPPTSNFLGDRPPSPSPGLRPWVHHPLVSNAHSMIQLLVSMCLYLAPFFSVHISLPIVAPFLYNLHCPPVILWTLLLFSLRSLLTPPLSPAICHLPFYRCVHDKFGFLSFIH